MAKTEQNRQHQNDVKLDSPEYIYEGKTKLGLGFSLEKHTLEIFCKENIHGLCR